MKLHLSFLLLLISIIALPNFVIAQLSFDEDAEKNALLYQYRASETRLFDLLHTKLEVSFDWKKQHLLGKASLSLTPYFYPQTDLVLDAKGMEIHEVLLKGDSSANKLEFDYDNNYLVINLDKAYEKKDTVNIYINYTAKPNERKIGGSAAIKSDKGLYFINPLNEELNKPQQIWTQGETESNSAWFPTIDAPNERCTQEMFITVQSKFKTLSNGELIYATDNGDNTRTDYWKMDQPHAPYLFMMTIGDFAVIEDEWEDVPLTYWVEKEYEQYAKDIFGNTPEMMGFFSDLLGVKYPWKKYAQVVVRDYVSGAMENTSASVFMEELHRTKRELKDENWDGIIAHELFHQWFGDLVTTESWSNLTLNEGFAEYSEYLWNEEKYGKEEADFKFRYTKSGYLQDAQARPKNLIRYYYESREDMFDGHSYNKGGLVLHMLRNYVGDDAFFASLKYYLTKNAYSSVEINDLRLAFEKVTGEDLNWFFEQWYLALGHPVLNINHEYKSDTLYLKIDQVQNTDSVPIFEIPVFVDVWMNNEKIRYPIVITEQKEVYKFQFDTKPQLVDFDAEKQLLAEINYPKTDEELLFQYLNATNINAKYEVLFSLSSIENDSINQAILNLALNDPFHNIREGAISFVLDGDYKLKKFFPKIIKLAQDKDPAVRSSAIYLLGRKHFKKQQGIIYQALSDESYYVMSTALNAINEAKAKLNDAQIKNLATENNIDVVLTFADYIIQNKLMDRYPWFVEKLSKLPNSELYYFIHYLSEFLIEAPQKDRVASVQILEKYARNNPNYMVRLSAYQGLLLLSDVQGVEAITKDIKENEKDERLIAMYKEM